MDRYVLYENKYGVHFIDTVVDSFNSISYDGACGDEFFIKDGYLYCDSGYINAEESSAHDVVFDQDVFDMGKVIYSTNEYDKVQDLAGLQITAEDLWQDYIQWTKNRKANYGED